MRAPPRIARQAPLHNHKRSDRIRQHHRDFIKQLPCVKCGRAAPSDPAHVRGGTDGGMGLKPNDRFLVPLCHTDHLDQHQRGELTFWSELGIDPVDLSARLWAVTGNLEQGERAVLRAQQAIALHKGEG